MKALAIVTAVLFFLHPAHAADKSEPAKIVIENVSVIDVSTGSARPGQRVTIRGERIASIGDPQGAPATGATVIDGRNLFLMPGLFDSHVHFINSDTYGPLCIAYGVTFVRDMGGPTEQILALRDQLNAGEVLGPEMIATGAIIDGNPPVWPFSEACNNAEEARAAVQKLAKAGVNEIKVYSKLPRDAYLAAIDEAHKHHLKAVGHIPLSVTLDDAIDAGQDTIEHLDGFDVLVAEAAGEEVPNPRSFADEFKRWELLTKVEKSQLQLMFARMRQRGTVNCPTMVVYKGIGQVGKSDSQDPQFAYVPSFLHEFWNSERYQRMAPGARAALPLMKQIVKDLNAAGVTLICGTDLANPNVFAGYSLHEEMKLFQLAGIPTADVLRSATIEPARVFGVADRLGTVEAGKTASLILTRANPLTDVRNALEIEGVFLRGKYFDRTMLDGLLKDVKDHCTPAGRAGAKSTELTLPGDVVRRGRYHLKFMEFDAGTEDFLIAKTPEGFAIKVDLKPRGGPQKPSVATFQLDRSHRLLTANWDRSISSQPNVEYTIKDKSITAKTAENGGPVEQKIELPSDWIISGPFATFDFANIGSIGLSVGQKGKYQNIWFGYPNWRMQTSEIAIERHENRRIKNTSGKEYEAAYYTTEQQVSMGRFSAQIWVDRDGVVVKEVLEMPVGTVTTELESP